MQKTRQRNDVCIEIRVSKYASVMIRTSVFAYIRTKIKCVLQDTYLKLTTNGFRTNDPCLKEVARDTVVEALPIPNERLAT